MTKKNKMIPSNGNTSISRKKKKIFLAILAGTGRIEYAAQHAGYSDSSFLRRCKANDEEFSKEWDLAVEAAGDVLESEAVRRGVEGVRKDVYYKGEVVGTEIVYSDGLLSTLLKGAKPEKYNKAQKSGGAGNFGVAVLPMTVFDAGDWAGAAQAVHNAQKQLAQGAEEPVEVEDAEYTEIKRS